MKLTANQIQEFETATASRTLESNKPFQNESHELGRPKTNEAVSTQSSSKTNIFGMKRCEPQNTYRHDIRKLDNLIEGFKTLYKNESEIGKHQVSLTQAQDFDDVLKQENKRRDAKIALKLELEKQIKAKELNQINQKIVELTVAAETEQVFGKEENLYSIHPRIYAKPDVRAR